VSEELNLKINASLLIAANQKRSEGIRASHGLRLAYYARHLDTSGSSWVKQDALREYVLSLEVSQQTFDNWLKSALTFELLVEGRDDKLSIPSLGKLAHRVGAEYISKPVLVNDKQLAHKGWKSLVWNAEIATLKAVPRSRKALEKRTRVPHRTQARYEKAAGINRIKNLIPLQPGSKDDAQAMNEALDGYHYSEKGRIYQRLPDLRVSNGDTARTCKKGRTKKARKELAILSTPSGREKGQTHRRSYYLSERGARAAIREDQRNGVSDEDYYRARYAWQKFDDEKGCNYWAEVGAEYEPRKKPANG